jgi:hypothetical protein
MFQCEEGLFKIRKCQKAESNDIHLTPNWVIFPCKRLANDEVLAVAYQYTIGDKVYRESLGMTVLMQRL